MEKKELVMDQRGLFSVRRIQEEPLDDYSKIIMDALLEKPIEIPRMIENGRMELSKFGITIGQELKTLQLSAHFTPRKDGALTFLCPFFHNNDDSLPMIFHWTPPPTCKICFVERIKKSGETYSYSEIWMVCQHRETGKIFIPPLSNIFNDAKVCMGDDWKNERQLIYPVKMFEAAIEYFSTAKWNGDLADNARIERCSKLFRFSPEGKQYPCPEKWEEIFISVSSEEINDFMERWWKSKH